MPPEEAGGGSPKTARARPRPFERTFGIRALLVVLGFLILAGGLVSLVMLATGESDEPTVAETTSTTIAPAGDEAFVETSEEAATQNLGRAKFISVMLHREGGMEAYSLMSSTEEFARLADLLPGREIELHTDHRADATIVFVSDDRSTVTFELDLSERVLVRDGSAWEVESAVGDLLRALATRPS